jgi:hypothetical protein
MPTFDGVKYTLENDHITDSEIHKDILKYVVFGRLHVQEELTCVCLIQIKIPYTYSFYKEHNGTLTKKTIKVDYKDIDKDFIMDDETNNTILKYLSEKYDCNDTTSTFIDKDTKIKFLSITKDFEDETDNLDGGRLDVTETLVILLNGKRTVINFEFRASYDWSNGLIPSFINIKYKNKVDADIDKQVQEFIKDACEEYEYVADEKYPYYMTNLKDLKRK